MASRARKRPRAIRNKNRADCPFAVTTDATPPCEEQDHGAKKRKRDGPDNNRKELVQTSPFEPKGKFKTHQTMDLSYAIEPRKQWFDMTRYNSFVLNHVKYYDEDFVYIANDTTIKRQKATYKDPERRGLLQLTDYWVAKILEVRALDEHHVYARVYWMYSPDELPPNTLDNKKLVSGRQPYHGQNELIASNHMDVINVVSVAMRAVVNQWVESDDEQVQGALYWRQSFDCRTYQLSSVDLRCKCKTPANPDKMLVGCSNPHCEQWLHHECLLHELLMRVYEELETDKPHKPEESVIKTETDEKQPAALRSTTPTDMKGAATQSPIAVNEGANGDSVPMKQIDSFTPRPTESPAPGTPVPAAAEKQSGLSSVKNGRSKKAARSKPYEGLFEAKLKLDDVPTVWEVNDLRPNVSGDDRTWTENVICLVCGSKIE